MFALRLMGRGPGRVFLCMALLGIACADGDETQTYTYTADPANVTRTDPPGTTVTVSPNQPNSGAPGGDPAVESSELDDGLDLDAVGGAGGFGGSTPGLGGTGGFGGGVPLGGASGVDVSADPEADGLGGTGFGGTTGTAGAAGSAF